jgi:hypothetical protein
MCLPSRCPKTSRYIGLSHGPTRDIIIIVVINTILAKIISVFIDWSNTYKRSFEFYFCEREGVIRKPRGRGQPGRTAYRCVLCMGPSRRVEWHQGQDLNKKDALQWRELNLPSPKQLREQLMRSLRAGSTWSAGSRCYIHSTSLGARGNLHLVYLHAVSYWSWMWLCPNNGTSL